MDTLSLVNPHVDLPALNQEDYSVTPHWTASEWAKDKDTKDTFHASTTESKTTRFHVKWQFLADINGILITIDKLNKIREECRRIIISFARKGQAGPTWLDDKNADIRPIMIKQLAAKFIEVRLGEDLWKARAVFQELYSTTKQGREELFTGIVETPKGKRQVIELECDDEVPEQRPAKRPRLAKNPL